MAGTFGLSLELQIVDQDTHTLVCKGSDIMASLDGSVPASRRVKTGARQDFLELISSEHEHPAGLLAQMMEIKQQALEATHANQAYLIGGGVHPQALWSSEIGLGDQTDLACSPATSSVFGARVLVGVSSGDQALALIQRLTPFVPHLIALSASSAFMIGSAGHTGCSRLLSGLDRRMPDSVMQMASWEDFERYMLEHHDGHNLEYATAGWDIVPRPELGAVELRVLDTPLTIERACQVAGFIQALSEWVWRQDTQGTVASPAPSLLALNRMQASCHGLDAAYVRTLDGTGISLREDILTLIDHVLPVADELGSLEQVASLAASVQAQRCDADWLRAHMSCIGQPDELARRMAIRFDASQCGPIDGEQLASRSALAWRAWSLERMKTDQGFRSLMANRLAPGMSVADFDRQL